MYEDAIEEAILKNLKDRYGLEDEKLLRYIALRCMILNNNLTLNTFINYIIKECQFELLEYKGHKVYKVCGFENSLGNIVSNWLFRLSLYPIENVEGVEVSFDEYINSTYKEIVKNSKSKSNKYKNEKFYKEALDYFRLQELNKLFNVQPKPFKPVEDFKYDKDILLLTREEECYRYIHAMNFESYNYEIITEKQLQKFLAKNLEIIEEGLFLIETEFVIDNGRIDILAMDKNNEYVIIELKVQEDCKDIIWQSCYYPIAFSEIMNTDNVRMMTICPNYPEHILKPLEKLENIEKFEFKPQIENKKLIGLKLKKLVHVA